jgi:Carboxypeptidase regulatory-like domain
MPDLHGRVVDSAGVPVSGAKVAVDGADSTHSVQMKTDAKGGFSRHEEVRWAMVPLLPLDAIGPVYRAQASYGESRSEPKEAREGIMNPHFFGLGNKTDPVDFGDLVIKGLPLR